MTFKKFTIFEKTAALDELHSSMQGLGDEAVTKLQAQARPAAAPHPKWLEILLRQLASPFIYLLIAAAALSTLLNEFIDAAMVLLFIFINTALSFSQEYRSEKALQLLSKFNLPRARVRRAGQEFTVEYSQLVVGDLVVLETGDIIPVDVRFVDTNNLYVNETILTGESVAVAKTDAALAEATGEIFRAGNIGFAGTHVESGAGIGLVIACGEDTVAGDIGKLTNETRKVSGMERNIQQFSRFILILVVLTLAGLFVANLLLKGGRINIPDLLIFSVALAVSVIPEALPLVITFSLTKGALHLSKNKVIVKRLSAIEDLGGINVLCTDKTGTLTENELSVVEVFAHDPDKAIMFASLGANFLDKLEEQPNNSFDLALWKKLTPELKSQMREYTLVNELPFSPERRRNSVLLERGGEKTLVVRGGVEALIKFCTDLTAEQGKQALDIAIKEGKKGNRTIAIARHKHEHFDDYDEAAEEKDLELLGIISFQDPIKKTTKATILDAKRLQVQVKMITGDSREVAGAVGCEIGLIKNADEVITGEELERLKPAEQARAVAEYNIFARVSPQQKFHIISLLKLAGFNVGYLGEGINDAPALKLADVALVVESAADIAREAADIILLDTSLKVIVDGIKTGRGIFANTSKYIKATLASNFGNFYAIAIASLLVNFLPMLSIQILLVNLLSDFPMIAISTDNVDREELHSPQSYHIREVIFMALVLGIVSTVFDFLAFAAFFRQGESVLQTQWFMTSVLTELAFLWSIRTKRFFLRGARPSAMILLGTAFAALAAIIIPFTQFGQEFFKFVQPSNANLLVVAAIVGGYFVSTEIAKLLYYKFTHPVLK
jgi:Mg2+-importing ATPase